MHASRARRATGNAGRAVTATGVAARLAAPGSAARDFGLQSTVP